MAKFSESNKVLGKPLKSKRPKNSTYETLVLHYKEPLMITKFHFSYVAGIFKSYLVSFQTDSPMVPFMSDEIESFPKVVQSGTETRASR